MTIFDKRLFYNKTGDIMRLWHQYILPHLPSKQLIGQHRELCALRGLGFGKKHRIVNYVFEHPYYYLYKFHMLVITEMARRNYKVDKIWYNYKYRGKNLGYDYSKFTNKCEVNKLIYYEHNLFYLEECLSNLNKKGIKLVVNKSDFLSNYLLNTNLLKYIKIID